MFNVHVIKALLRHVISFAGGIVIAMGWLDANTVATLSGSLETLLGILLGVGAAGLSLTDKIVFPPNSPPPPKA